ncbi:MAG: pyridoxamine 5'-phosphate oxidase family protein, partial [Solirubrobacteraceae bacterium]
LVLARSAMHHSANYRSAMLLGTGRPVEDPAEKAAALEAVVEHIVPGRWPDVRWPTENELKATAVVAIGIEEASAKIRTGQPVDEEADYELGAWAGIIPLACRPGPAEPDPRMPAERAIPPYLAAYSRPSAG